MTRLPDTIGSRGGRARVTTWQYPSVPEFPPRLRAHVEIGVPVLRDGWVAVFYLPDSCDRHRAAVAESVAEYLRLVDSPDLRLTIDEEGYPVALTDAEIAERLAYVAKPSGESVGLSLMDRKNGVSGHRLRYMGFGADDPIAGPEATSLLLLTYTSETVERLGLERFARFHDELADRLPLSTGYVSPAFLAATGAGEPAAFEVIRAIWREHPCLDIPYISLDWMLLGDRIRGAYWLNYLAPGTVDPSTDPDLLVRELSSGTMAIQVDGPPDGDPAPYRRLAESFAPRAFRPTIPFPEFDAEEIAAWFARFDPS
ncbi:uncharacterized protein DUF3396 [Nocardia alba]|uniref:Uncharacterized protein DUF3396 n=1 Tax=Nocardia alba TaxID=225051 RepID=A0A4R1FP81_9NOCA|nr:uncharacterized protein DUF3396 [Nocardia alba]